MGLKPEDVVAKATTNEDVKVTIKPPNKDLKTRKRTNEPKMSEVESNE